MRADELATKSLGNGEIPFDFPNNFHGFVGEFVTGVDFQERTVLKSIIFNLKLIFCFYLILF